MRLDGEGWRDDLALHAEPGEYVRPLAIGALAQLVVGLVAAVVVGFLGYALVSGYAEGDVPAGRTVAVGVLGVVSVVVAVLAGGLVTGTRLRAAGRPARHARAVAAVWSGGLALVVTVLLGAVGGSSLGQWFEGVLGVVLGVGLVLARSPLHDER
ncbi:hypothetical protein GCM10027446_12370 [Angustibacter peucedani]